MFFVEETIRRLLGEFESIPPERRKILRDLALFIQNKVSHNRAIYLDGFFLGTTDLTFICTHNSRRSHIAQIWAQTAASYFSIPNIRTFSGGTEATAFNIRAVNAMRELGFRIDEVKAGSNPRYSVQYADNHPAFEVFSKRYDDPENPSGNFCAVMTCSHADENCPVVIGASARFSLPFDDPKDFDGTELESIKYHERSLEIGRQVLYIFSQIATP